MAQAGQQSEERTQTLHPELVGSQQLLARFEELLQQGNFSAANAVAEELELALAEEGATLTRGDFFVQYLATLIILRDLTNTRLLWRRLPAEIRNNATVARLWDVAKNLLQMNLAEVYTLLGSAWEAPADALIPQITESIRQAQLSLIARAYSTIALEKLAVALGLDPSAASSYVTNLGWQVSDGRVTPKRTEDLAGEEGARGVEADQQRLRQMAQYLQLFEQKALEVDFSVITERRREDKPAGQSSPSGPNVHNVLSR